MHSGPRYSSRIVETKSGAIRGVILELNSRHLEPVEVSITLHTYIRPYLILIKFSQNLYHMPLKNFISPSARKA